MGFKTKAIFPQKDGGKRMRINLGVSARAERGEAENLILGAIASEKGRGRYNQIIVSLFLRRGDMRWNGWVMQGVYDGGETVPIFVKNEPALKEAIYSVFME